MKKTFGIKIAFCMMFLFILFFSNKVFSAEEITVLKKNDTE